MNKKFAGTASRWVTPTCSSFINRRPSVGSKVRITMFLPPKWKAGLAKQLSPPVWNSGRITRFTMFGPHKKNSVQLIAFQNAMPWVIIAPFGRPVVPEVYMIVRRSSWVDGWFSSSGSGSVVMMTSS